MSELTRSLEKSIAFLRKRYPDGHPLLTCLQEQLSDLRGESVAAPAGAAPTSGQQTPSCCSRLAECAFFTTVKQAADIPDVLEEFVKVYCCGPATERCFRLRHIKAHGEPPADNISPAGEDFLKYLGK